MHVTFDESYLRNFGKGISFHEACASLEDILKDTEEGINHPEAVEPEKEEDDEPIKEEEESPTEVNEHPFAWKTAKDHHSTTFFDTSLKA